MVRYVVEIEERYASFFEELMTMFEFCKYEKHTHISKRRNTKISRKTDESVDKLSYLKEVRKALDIIEEKRNKLNK